MTMSSLKLDMWTDILLTIDDYPEDNITGIQKKSGCTYAHILDIIQLLKDHNLITTMQRGRTTVVDITKDGQLVASSIRTIKEKI